MTPLQENKLMNAILKAVVKGKGKKAIAIAAKKDRKLGMKVKDIVNSIFKMQKDIDKLDVDPKRLKKFQDILS